MNVRAVGEYIRNQRKSSRLSLRKVSGLAGVSIPYLSQVERGLRKPSAEILQAIAKALRISAETLYVQAGFLEYRAVPDVATAILGDPTITERQKQALLQIYDAFRDETARVEPEEGSIALVSADGSVATTVATVEAPPSSGGRKSRPRSKAAAPPKSTKKTSTRRSTKPATKLGGGAEAQALSSPHPAPLRPSATNQ